MAKNKTSLENLTGKFAQWWLIPFATAFGVIWMFSEVYGFPPSPHNFFRISIVALLFLLSFISFKLNKYFQNSKRKLLQLNTTHISPLEIIGTNQNHNMPDALYHLEEVKGAKDGFKFMGLGFGQFTKNISNTDKSILEELLENLTRSQADSNVQIILFNPFANVFNTYEHDASSKIKHDILHSLKRISELKRRNNNKYAKQISSHFYPNSFNAAPNFRLVFVDTDKLYVSYYRFSEQTPNPHQIQIVKSGDKNFYHPFRSLFEYFWDNGQEADYYGLYYPVKAHVVLKHPINDVMTFLNTISNFYFDKNYTDLQNVCLVSISGRGSIAAIFDLINQGTYDLIVPVIVKTPNEYYEIETNPRLETLKKLRSTYEPNEIPIKGNRKSVISPAIYIEDDYIWGQYMQFSELRPNANMPTKCFDCHSMHCLRCLLFVHALRCHLASSLGIKYIFAGDGAENANGKKVYQYPEVLETYKNLLYEQYQVFLEFPIQGKELKSFFTGNKIQQHECIDFNCHFKNNNKKIPDFDVDQAVTFLTHEAIASYRKVLYMR